MSKLSKEKRDRIILVGFVTVVASAAIWFLVINTQTRALKSVRSEVEKSRDQLARGNATLLTKVTVNQQFEAASEKLKAREVVMAAPNDMYSWLIATLTAFRSDYRVEIPQFGRETPSEVGVFPKFPYRAALFTVRGSAYYHDFGKFLADFENTFPFIRVQNIELTPLAEVAGAGQSREKLSFQMELLTLVKPIAP